MQKYNFGTKINVRDFIYKNITPYDGDENFLVGPSVKTNNLWNICKDLMKQELANGWVLDIDVDNISNVTSHKPWYIKKEDEVIVWLQTDEPLKRAIKPNGWIKVVEKACEENWKTLNPEVSKFFRNYRKTHNDWVFDGYTDEIKALRSNGIVTGLPDNYARWRIIWDYRRVALYWIDILIEEKEFDKKAINWEMTDDAIRLREEVSEQIRALKMMKEMASNYGFDISQPAKNSKEAVQWTYFAYLASLKEHDGAAMSLGNVSSFFDIYIEKDLQDWIITEEEAQELIDQFIMKLRIVRHLRMSEYNNLFAGDPTWLTESLAGAFNDGKHKVTKTTYRFLHTLYNLGPSPEPNLTVLWSSYLPENFKKYAAKVSIETSSIQYENDDVMREMSDYDDYGISCCVSQLKTGKQMQFFWARCNLGKTLLLAINEWKDENSGVTLLGDIPKINDELNYEEVMQSFWKSMAKVAEYYVNTMNIIHYMHDKYYYERVQMALLQTDVERVMAFGIAGLSVVVDSLSAIKYAQVKAIRNENWITTGFEINGDFPKYGNDDDKADDIAKEVVEYFNNELKKHKVYKDAIPTLSVLTITSNVVYGKKTWATPDGRLAGESFAPGANPGHWRDTSGAIASLNSVAKLDYEYARDGISNTFSIVPKALGIDENEQKENLVDLLNGYFSQKAHHLNVNVLNKETLLKAMEEPENYPQLTIRVSGYAVNFVKLTKEQQKEVLARTFHENM